MDKFVQALIIIVRDSGIQFLMFFGVLILSGWVLNLISSWIGNSFRQFLFPRFGLYFFGIIGIPIHELCHAIFAKIFFHEIESVKWFDASAKGGAHGAVVHSYDEKNLYHRIGMFFIGMAPVLLAPIFLFFALHWLVPHAINVNQLNMGPSSVVARLLHSLANGQNWREPGFYFFLYFALCLTSQMELSPEDMKIARSGLLPFFAIVLAINAVAYFCGLELHAKFVHWFNSTFYLWTTCLAIAVLLGIFNLLICYVVLNVVNRGFGHQSINPFER